MKKKRKYFGSIYAKTYVGDKSVNIHFGKEEKDKAIILARGILQAIENNKSIDIVTYYTKKNKEAKNQITVTGV
ncbi:MAG: hypothetical protein ACKKMP_02955 [Candidatus Nealsonbacteria bacterium]